LIAAIFKVLAIAGKKVKRDIIRPARYNQRYALSILPKLDCRRGALDSSAVDELPSLQRPAKVK